MTTALAALPQREVLVPPVLARELLPPALGARLHTLAGDTMGTRWQVRVCGPARLDLAALRAAIEHELEMVVATMSPWREQSDIARHQRAAPGSWTQLSPACADVLTTACAVAEASDGAFDPTVGAAVDHWGFGPAAPGQGPFEPRPAPGWRTLRFEPSTRRLYQPGGVRLDLCGIAKGDAVDRVSDRLCQLGWRDHLVEIGGELRGRGLRPDGQPWWVQVETPPDLRADVDSLVGLHEMAIATSGDYRRVRTDAIEGRPVSHTIDPRRGRPLAPGLASVTVLHPRCREADAWATALMVLGPARGLDWAEARDCPACFVLRGAAGRAERRVTSAWRSWAA